VAQSKIQQKRAGSLKTDFLKFPDSKNLVYKALKLSIPYSLKPTKVSVWIRVESTEIWPDYTRQPQNGVFPITFP